MSTASSAVRPAQVADLEAIVPLAIALGRQHVGYAPHRFRLELFAGPISLARTYRDFLAAQLARPDAAVLVATDPDGHVVGYAFGRLEEASFLDLCPPSGWLHDLYLDPEARGHGLGPRLLDVALERLRALGAGLLMLSVSPRNESARRLFATRGFAPTMTEHAQAADAPRAAPALTGGGHTGAEPGPSRLRAETSLMADLTFVPVTTGQVDALLAFIASYYALDGIAFDEPEVRRGVLALLAHPAYGGAWLVHWGGQPVGHFVLTYGFDLEFGGRQATLTELFLEPGSRGRGLGRATLRFVEQTLRGLGIGALELQVERTNTEARAFYARLGFEVHDRLPLSKRLG